MKKLYMVTDLGPGDGGKGGVVHKLAHWLGAHHIVKVGGAQGSHGVRTASGESFAFSQFGCGTFEGVPTFLSERFVVDPIGILNEATALRSETRVHDPLSLLTVDSRALCNTPYHGILSRLLELSLRDTPRGTIGTGVGQAVRLAETHPELTIYAGDLKSPHLRDKLAAVRTFIRSRLLPLRTYAWLPADVVLAGKEWAQLDSDDFFTWVIEHFSLIASQVRITDSDYLAGNILNQPGVVVCESSHGILTDAMSGFHPHTSALRTLPHFTRDMFMRAGYDGKIVSLGVHRGYQIRHGAGPMVTADPAMAETLLPGSHKDNNRWQGDIRVGSLDLIALRYALAVCGPDAFDGLAITWFDQIKARGRWDITHRYHGAMNPTYFNQDGNIKVRSGEGAEQLAYLAGLTNELYSCTPDVTSIPLVNSASHDELYALCADTLHTHLGVRVRMISFGSTERDKVCK